jgi:hypothetical protein
MRILASFFTEAECFHYIASLPCSSMDPSLNVLVERDMFSGQFNVLLMD